jgi:hypothetical protein
MPQVLSLSRWHGVCTLFLGVGDKSAVARIDIAEESIKDRQDFDQDHWPEQTEQSFLPFPPRNAERPVGANPPTER